MKPSHLYAYLHTLDGKTTIYCSVNDFRFRSFFYSRYETAASFIQVVSVIFAISFVPASFTTFLVDERSCKSKHLQYVSGVNSMIYWIVVFIWDLVRKDCLKYFIRLKTERR